MPLTRLDNLISSKTGKYLYVSPDDFNATDALSNRGNSPVTPFKSIQRAFLEIARYSYLPGFDNDRFDQFSIMLMPGIHYIDNRPGLADTTGIDIFGFDETNNEWTDDSILDISNPDNVLYKFNNTEGGAIIPRGSSLVGYDLRRTVVRPLYVPDPASVTVPRSAIFNVTGGCYFWQFTIKDGQTTSESPLYNTVDGTGEVYYDPNDFSKKAAPNYSHHKLTVFEYADTEELSLFYRKIAKGFSAYQPTIADPGEFDFRVQENRIVGPLSDSRIIESLTFNDSTSIPSIPASTSEITVTTKTDHGYFAGQFVAISNTELDTVLEGIFPITKIDQDDPRKFTYEVPVVVSAIGTNISASETKSVDTTPALGQNAQTLAEVDSVESASPYVFNCSIRSTWGICGIWANGLKATGFKSMVIAQYTGVSLQKDDRAFIRYDEYSNTWNQASLVDAFAEVPYHAKGDSYWKDDWRNFHVRASEDAFIQNVSIFAVGFADHFLMESGGDMSITNSNSNFGNTSLHAIGFKGFAFNQDKGGYISDIIPPKEVEQTSANIEKIQYYTIDIAGTNKIVDNYTQLYLGADNLGDPNERPAVSLGGYRLGAKGGEKLYVNLAGEEFNATVTPTGFTKYVAAPSILNPSGEVNTEYSTFADAANLIESNRKFIQEETFGYILQKYPRLQNISYVNPGRDPLANRYFDARNLIVLNRQDIINRVLNSVGTFKSDTLISADQVGDIVDAISEDVRDGGNSNVLTIVETYFDGDGNYTLLGGDVQEKEAFRWAIARVRDFCKQAIANLLQGKADIWDPNPDSPLALYNDDFANGGKYKPEIGIVQVGKTGSQAEEDGDSTNAVTLDASGLIDPGSRFKDAYYLLRKNREYILDNALAEIAVYHPDFYYPGEPQTDSRSRFKDGYRYIRRNKENAITAAVDAIATNHPTFVYPSGGEEKCRRDLGYFIDALGMDVYLGGNTYIRNFIQQYFPDPTDTDLQIPNGLLGEKDESITAFNAARDRLIELLSNSGNAGEYFDVTITEGDSQYGAGDGPIDQADPAACTDVKNAVSSLTAIVTQVLSDQNTESIHNSSSANYVDPTSRSLNTNEEKCRRDVGHIVDAVAQDIYFGGNAYSISAAKAYFNSSGAAISNGLIGEEAPSVTVFKRAADAINQAINNQLYFKDAQITLDQSGDPPIVGDIEADAHDIVLNNKKFIAKEAYERMLALYPDYLPQETNTEQDCLDDVYNVLEEVMYDVKFGGNAKTYDSAEIYITNVMPYFGLSKKRKQFTPTNATYDPSTGLVVLTVPGHDMVEGEYIKFAPNSFTFTCAFDNNQDQKTYPREGDSNFNQWMQIVDIDDTDNSLITVNAGVSASDRYLTPSNATYNSTTGELVIDFPVPHQWEVGQGIRIADNSFTFTCAQDGNATQHTYPRPGQDPWAGKSITIESATSNSITVNVGDAGSAAGVDHQYVTAANNSVYQQPQSQHTFISAAENCINYGVSVETFLQNERTEARQVFVEVQLLLPDIIKQVAITPSANNTESQVIDTKIVDDWDTTNVCANPIAAAVSLLDIITESIGTDISTGTLTATRTVPDQPQTFDIMPQPGGYTPGNCSDVVSAVNTLIDLINTVITSGDLDDLPELSNGEWDCANVRSTIETLSDILIDTIDAGSLSDLPTRNSGGFTTVAEVSKCYRDVSYIVDAIVSDLRLGGNINSVQAGEAYFVGNQLEYIDGEKTETIDAWNYVRNLSISAMRNFDHIEYDCDVVMDGADPTAFVRINGGTEGLVVGMRVEEYNDTSNADPAYRFGVLINPDKLVTDTVPAGTYIKKIVNQNTIELGEFGSYLEDGVPRLCEQNKNNFALHFQLDNGAWANTLPSKVTVGLATDVLEDGSAPDVLVDTQTSAFSPECNSTKLAIIQLMENITTIINNGLGTVARQEQTTPLGAFTGRATVFSINVSGQGFSNPHNFETGTPVRLVPRPRFDYTLGKYVDVDKRLVRLPNGFETNRTYYVIAPGRETNPTRYNETAFFDGSDQTKLMLATSPENAAAGNYIYASESDSIDPDVEIDMYQFLLDTDYDMHKYNCEIDPNVFGGIRTDVAHIFDVQNSAITPQKVFFRASDTGDLPLVSVTYASDSLVAVQDSSDANFGRINPLLEFYVRYHSPKVITIHKSHSDAINDNDRITFTAGQRQEFLVFSNKRLSPVRFNPSFTDGKTSTGKWFIQCLDEGSPANDVATRASNIFKRIKEIDLVNRDKSTDMWFTRLEDTREADDRTYKLRYVIPKYLENARDPINGFVIKTRTDDTRKLVPQKVLLKPVAGTVYGARFVNPVQGGEFIGQTSDEIVSAGLDLDKAYDPYKKDTTGSGIEYRSFARFNSGIQATIQSGRYVVDEFDPTISYLELDLFDHTVDTKNFPGLRNESFTTVKINAPQGGEFTVNKTASVDANRVEWTGNSSGIANIHAYFSIGGDHYIIIKNIRGGKLEFSEYYDTRFTQGDVFADMLEDQDMGKSLPLKTLIRKNYPEYFYKQNGANVYTITPGDTIQDDAGIEYYVDSVEDAGVIEDTFYVFSYETLQRRIAGQQDGIYYLSCLRGNISPLPTGAGVSTNFRKFKFSQPVSSLYPLNYKNDPLWFQKAGTSDKELAVVLEQNDPPATYSAADNYTHGLVTTNDYKGSVTKELVVDLLEQPAFRENLYTNTTSDDLGEVIDNRVRAQKGNATNGSEDRRIPISGDNQVVSDQRYYVELRRPSIARAGNHTFEYLGFGPGNYSTGLPARQEIVLTPTEDFYAQSKKQDAGIVFYTGLNSNGDLYIGNRKINAITGEETFLEQAVLADDGSEDDPIGNLVTSFDTPVTFNENITVVGGDGDLTNTFQSPVVIEVQDDNLAEIGAPPLPLSQPLVIRSFVSQSLDGGARQQDPSLHRNSWGSPGNPDLGDIRIGQNRIDSAIFAFNPRYNGQPYKIQTHVVGSSPSNITPNNSALVSAGGTKLTVAQSVSYGSLNPISGDMLLKGEEVGSTGSLGWIYANYWEQIGNTSIFNVTYDGSNVIRLEWRDQGTGAAISNSDLGISLTSQIRFTNFIDSRLNLAAGYSVYNNPNDFFNPASNYVYIQVIDNITAGVDTWGPAGTSGTVLFQSPNATIQVANANWKEFGVLGAEALRTYTEDIGDYRLGINTIARTPHSAHLTAFVDNYTTPRATLDVVGTAFISGKTIGDYLNEATDAKTETNQDNAFLVGGEYDDPSDEATLRVMTTNGGRVGINTAITDSVNPYKELNKTLVVVGNARIHEELEVTGDLQVNAFAEASADITTTNEVLNLFESNAKQINFVNEGQNFFAMNNYDGSQNISIANSNTQRLTFVLGDVAGSTGLETRFDVFRQAKNASLNLGAYRGDETTKSRIDIGGAFANASTTDSYIRLGNRYTIVDGSIEVGYGYGVNAGPPSAGEIFTRVRTGRIFCNQNNSTVELALNATQFRMGSSGGSTTVNNSLNVAASANVEGDIRLNGGLRAGIIRIKRGRFNTTPASHNVAGVENPNIDFYKYQSTGRIIDTPGQGPWGSTAYLVAGGGITAFEGTTDQNDPLRTAGVYEFVQGTASQAGSGALFTVNISFNDARTVTVQVENPGEGYTDGETITIAAADIGTTGADLVLTVTGTTTAGTNYYLPIGGNPIPGDFSVGDLILIDRGNALSPNTGTSPRDQQYSEIVEIVGIANISNPQDSNGYRLVVSRNAEGTTARIDHPDECVLAVLDKQANASYITGSDLNNDGLIDNPEAPTGIIADTADVNIGLAEFGGTLTTQDFLRLSGSEIVGVDSLITTSPQSLIVNDGGNPAVEVFTVESTTGNTLIAGDVGVGTGFNKFTIDGSSGNTNIAGTLTVENTLTINGSRNANTEFFTITDGGVGGSNPIAARTTLQVDTSNGNLDIYGGNFNIWSAPQENGNVEPKLDLDNQSGDLTVYGSFSAVGSGVSRFGGQLVIGQYFGFTRENPDPDNPGWNYTEDADLVINGGDLTINSAGEENFKVSNTGEVMIAGLPKYFSNSGARRWENAQIEAGAVTGVANVNYFVNAADNTLFRLPSQASMGDMIYIIDISGSLSYNKTLVVRAPDNVKVQGDVTNTGTALLSGIGTSKLSGYNGGELVVQTPNAAFALVYAGTTSDGTGVAGDKVGWYLMDI